MKTLKYIFTSALFVILVGNLSMFAADNINGYNTGPDPETIHMQKIAFYTKELQLTPQEAEKFWPLYNEYWDARMKAHHEAVEAIKKLEDALDAEPAATDSEIKKLSEIYLLNSTAEGDLLKEYFAKFQKILPIKKAAKIFNAEEKFRRLLIKQLRGNAPKQYKNGTPPPPPQHKH